MGVVAAVDRATLTVKGNVCVYQNVCSLWYDLIILDAGIAGLFN